MKKSKIIITICMVAVLMMTLCVSTFASGNVLEGVEVPGEVDTTEIVGTWVFNDNITLPSSYQTYVYTRTQYSDIIGKLVLADQTTIDISCDWYFSNHNMYFGIRCENSKLEFGSNSEKYSYYASQLSGASITIYENIYNLDIADNFLPFLQSNATKIAPSTETIYQGGIFDVLNEIPSFLTTGLTTVTALFYTDGELTFVGYLAIASLAISVCFLVISIIRNFLHFRG